MVATNYRYRWEKQDNPEYKAEESWELELFEWDKNGWNGKSLYAPFERIHLPWLTMPKSGQEPIRKISVSLFKPSLITKVDPDIPSDLRSPTGSIQLMGGPTVISSSQNHIYTGKIDSRLRLWNTDGFDTWWVIEAYFLRGELKEGQDCDSRLITKDSAKFNRHLTKRFAPHTNSAPFGQYLFNFLKTSNLPEKYLDFFRSALEFPCQK